MSTATTPVAVAAPTPAPATENVVEKVFDTIGHDVKAGVKAVLGLEHKVVAFLDKVKAEVKLVEGPTISAMADVVVKTESFIAACANSATSNGLNFAADSIAYQDFLALKDSVVKAAAQVGTDISVFTGK